MKHISPTTMMAFNAQLQKEAAFSSIIKGIGRAGSYMKQHPTFRRAVNLGIRGLEGRYGRQVGLGAGVGAITGGLTAEEGEGLSGALKGGLIGGGVMGGRILATGAGREALKKSTGKFLQRQRHSLTGGGPKTVEEAQRLGIVRMPAEGLKGKALERAKKLQKLDEAAFRSGYTSVPGIVKGLATRPRDVLRSGWQRGGLMGKGLAGLGTYETGKSLLEKPEPGGPGRLQKALGSAAGTVGWLTAPPAMLGGMLMGTGAGMLGRQVGRLGDVGVQAVRRQTAPQSTQLVRR